MPALNAGTYNVNGELTGFAPIVKNNVILFTGATLTVDLRLGLAAVE